ncbi:hypothetical protein ACVR1G_02290 [Streptococcus dentasini]
MMNMNIKKIFFPNSQAPPKPEATDAASVPDFETFVELVMAIPEEKFYQDALKADPVYGRMTEELKAELIAEAVTCGSAYAEGVRTEAPDLPALLEREGIIYTNPPIPSGGSYLIFAQYVEPNKITVFQDSIDKFLNLVSGTKYQHDFSEKALKQLLIAHEYFHYLEFKDAASVITKSKKMVLWSLLGYRYQTTFISLSEMSAMAFAKAYLGLAYSPFILDCLLTYAYNKEMSYQIYQNIRME